MRTKCEWALYLATLDYWVFRCKPNGKTPYKTGWQAEATRDPDRIIDLWDEEPDCNVGILTTKHGDGKALCVVDVDNKDGRDGDGQIIDLEMKGFTFPATATNITPTGGKHYIYRCDRPVKQGAGVLGTALDIRSRGGYIVGPGSTLEGKLYMWTPKTLAKCPDWLFAKLSISLDLVKKAVDPGIIDPDRARNRAMAYLALAVRPQEGTRNDSIFKIACELKDRGVTEDVCAELMGAWNDELDDPLEVSELELALWSAYKNGQEAMGVKAPEAVFKQQDKSVKKVKGSHPFEKLNEKFAFVVMGGNHHILYETTDEEGKPEIRHLAEPTFHKMLAHKTITIGPKPEALTKLWLADEMCRRYEGIVFAPGREVDSRFYNLWKGWACTPATEDEDLPGEAHDAFQKFLEHWHANVCGGSDALYGWAMARCAAMYQYPDIKYQTGVVLKGGKGVGKNSALEPLLALHGRHGLLVDNKRYLVSNFNSHLEHCSMLVIDEANWGGDKDNEGVLKGLITGKHHNIERKGLEPYKVTNRTNTFFNGNERWIVPASEDERRYAVFNVGNGRKQDVKFFQAIEKGMKLGGYRLLMSYMMAYDITPYELNTAPVTQGLIDQKHASLDVVDEFLVDCLHTDSLLYSDITGATLKLMPCTALRRALSLYVRARNVRTRLPDERTLAQHLAKVFPSLKKQRVRFGQGLDYCFTSDGVFQLRREWERHIGATDGMKWETDNNSTGELECLM